MFRTFAIAGAVALPLMFAGGSVPAKADTDVDIHFGIPFYSYQVEPGYRYRRGYGWYNAGRYRDFDEGYRGRMSCREARNMVRDRGYRRVAVRDCDGRTYTFFGTRNGRSHVIYVNARNGRMWRG